MGKKNTKSSDKKKQKAHSNNQGSSSSSSSGALIKRYYGFSDLDYNLRENLRSNHPETFTIYLDKLNNHSPEPLSAALIKNMKLALAEFEQYLQLFYTDKKLLDFKDGYIDRDYFINAYHIRISFLCYHLGDKEKAHMMLHNALIQCKHPTLIQTYRTMQNINLVEERHKNTYMLRLVQCVGEFAGTNKQKEEVNEVFIRMGYKHKEGGVIDFANQLFQRYNANNEVQKIESLVTVLSSSPTEVLKKHAPIVIIAYLEGYFNKNNLDEVDRIVKQFESLLLAPHYWTIANYLLNKMDKNGADEVSTRLCIKYLEKGTALGDLEIQLQTARILLYLDDGLLIERDKKAEGLRLIKQVQKSIGTSKTQMANNLRGDLYHLIGRIHDLGILAAHDPAYPQSESLALEYYTKSAQLKNAESLQDLGLAYQLGQGVKQDLAKADALLSESVEVGHKFSALDLGFLRLMQASKSIDVAEQGRLIDDGLLKMALVFEVEDTLGKYLLSRIHLATACLLFAKDTKIYLQVDPLEQTVQNSFDAQLIIDYCTTATHPNAAAVEQHLSQAFDYGNNEALAFLALLYKCGNYLELDYEKSEACYIDCANKGFYSYQLVLLNLSQSLLANKPEIKQDYLVKALKWHRYFVEHVDDPNQKIDLEQLFSEVMRSYSTKSDVCVDKLRVYRFNGSINFVDYNKPSGVQLGKAICAAEVILGKLEPITASFELELIRSFFDISSILKKSRHQVPAYLTQLPNLFELLVKVQKIFISLSTDTQIELIKTCSQWPLVADKGSPLSTMLGLTRPNELSFCQRACLVFAVTHIKHQEGLFEDDLLRLLFQKMDMSRLQDIKSAARLLYIYAIIHANGNERINSCIKDEIMASHSQLIAFINTHCWEAGPEDMSQLYHAINYLILVFPDQFTKLPDNLNKLMELNQKLIQKDDAVTISNQQQHVFDVLSSMAPNLEHEPLVNGRRVDFFNRSDKEVVFYHGPSHYLYTREGKPCSLNSATVFCENTLKKSGNKVSHIDYFQWNQLSDQQKQIDLIKATVPSLKDWQPKDNKQNTVTTKSGIGESSAHFWSKLPKTKGCGALDESLNLINGTL